MRTVARGAALLLLLAAANASAQVRPGLNELNLGGQISAMSAQGETTTIANLELRYGRFVSRAVELGVSLGATKFEDEDLFGTVGGFGAIHVGKEGATSVPYIGAELETGYGYDGDNPFTFGGFAGLKFFVTEGGALSTEAYLDRTNSGDNHWTTYGLRVGVSIFM